MRRRAKNSGKASDQAGAASPTDDKKDDAAKPDAADAGKPSEDAAAASTAKADDNPAADVDDGKPAADAAGSDDQGDGDDQAAGDGQGGDDIQPLDLYLPALFDGVKVRVGGKDAKGKPSSRLVPLAEEHILAHRVGEASVTIVTVDGRKHVAEIERV
jgi:hypothetical protein